MSPERMRWIGSGTGAIPELSSSTEARRAVEARSWSAFFVGAKPLVGPFRADAFPSLSKPHASEDVRLGASAMPGATPSPGQAPPAAASRAR